MRAKRKVEKVIEVVLEQDPLEQSSTAFVDDPRAAKEHEYGKVVRLPTYVPGGSND